MSSGVLLRIPAIQKLLGQCQRRIRIYSFFRGCADVVSMAAFCLLVSCLLDFLVVLPGVLRCILLATSALLTAVVFARRLILPLLTSAAPEEIGAAVDLRFPDLHEAMATLISLNRMDITASEAGSPLMQQRLQQQVQSRVGSIRPADVIQVQPVVHRASVAAVSLLITMAPLLLWPEGSRLLIQRLLMPFANLAAPTNLFFEIPDADRIVATGTDVSFAAIPRWRNGRIGVRPDDVTVELRTSDDRSELIPMAWDENKQQYHGRLQDARQTVQYRVTGGGAATEWYSLVVADPPRILGATLIETPPAYTGRPIQTVDGVVGEILVFERSALEIQLSFSKPIRTVELAWQNYQPIRESAAVTGEEMVPGENGSLLPEEIAAAASGVRMGAQRDRADDQPPTADIVLSPDGLAALIRMQATGSGQFEFHATDEYGLQNSEMTDRRLTVSRDTPPVLKVTGVSDGLEVRPDDVVPLNSMATDDIGVGLLELQFRKNQDALRVQPAVPMQRGATTVSHEFHIDLRTLSLTHGDTVEFRVRAADERPEPGPQVVWAGPWILRISDNAEPLGQKALREADQQLVDSLRKLAEQLGQDAVTAAQLREQAQRDWKQDVRDEVRALSEKEQTQGNTLQKLAEEVGQHPLMQKQATRLSALAQQVRENVPEKLDQAAVAEADPAAQNLQDASNELNRIREDLNRATDEIQKAAQLEQELAELNRLALDAQKLAEDSDEFRQKRESGKPEDGQSPQEFHQELNQQQQRLQSDQLELSEDLNSLLQRRKELLQAAREAQLNQAAEAAEQLQQLAQQQQQLAEGVSEEARDASHDADALANELQQARQQAEQIGQQVEQQAKEVTRPNLQPLDEAIRDLRQGNLATPQKSLQAAQQDLNATAKQLSKPAELIPQDPTMPVNDIARAAEQQALDSQNTRRQELSQKSAETAQQLKQISERIEQLAQNRGGNDNRPPQNAADSSTMPQADKDAVQARAENGDRGEPASPKQSQAEAAPQNEGDAGMPRSPNGTPGESAAKSTKASEATKAREVAENLLEQLEQLTEAAREQAEALKADSKLTSGAGNNAEQAAQRAAEAMQSAQAGQFQKAAERMRNSAGDSSQAADQLNSPELQDRQAQLLRQRDDLNRLADSFRQIQNDSAAQIATQQQAQRNVADQAAQIPASLQDLAERLNSPALGMQNLAAPSRDAAQAAQQGAASGNQASDNLQNTQLQQAGQSAQEAASQLQRAAQLAQQAAQGYRDPGNPVPADVGESVGDALQSLQKAAELMNQEAASAQTEPNAQEAGADGQPGEGQPQQGQPGDNPQASASQPEQSSGEGQPGQQPGDQTSAENQMNGQQKSGKTSAGQAGKSSEGQAQQGQGRSPGQSPSGSPQQLAKAARSLQSAAKGALPNRFSPGQLSADSSQASSDPKSEGNPAVFDGVNPMSTVKKGRRRQWGQLQDQLDNDVQDGGRDVLDSEYSEMIRRYRRDLARNRNQSPSGKTDQKP